MSKVEEKRLVTRFLEIHKEAIEIARKLGDTRVDEEEKQPSNPVDHLFHLAELIHGRLNHVIKEVRRLR